MRRRIVKEPNNTHTLNSLSFPLPWLECTRA
jgi:hypothetical protein